MPEKAYFRTEGERKRAAQESKRTGEAKKFRAEQKKSIQSLVQNIPQAKKYLHVHATVGRPPIEEKQPELLKTIVAISLHGSAAEGKRQDESIRSIKTLSELHEALLLKGFQISRSATYLRLLPHKKENGTFQLFLSNFFELPTTNIPNIRMANFAQQQYECWKKCPRCWVPTK